MAAKLFRPKDAEKLEKLHPDLRAVVYQCAELGGQFIVITTVRGKVEQNKAHNTGFSNAVFGKSPHNFNPALGVDLGPSNYPGTLDDYRHLAHLMFTAAAELHIGIVWGGDWKSIKDFPHFELTKWRTMNKKLAV